MSNSFNDKRNAFQITHLKKLFDDCDININELQL